MANFATFSADSRRRISLGSTARIARELASLVEHRRKSPRLEVVVVNLSHLSAFITVAYLKLPLRLRQFLKRRRVWLWVTSLLLIIWWNCVPRVLFEDPYSSVLHDRNGLLLGARIAKDGQWRFPLEEVVPPRFADALVEFEDKRFYRHPGVDPFAFARALWLNVSAGEVRSGASTITMQVIRLARKGKRRSIIEKMVELVQATRLEARYSKQEILALYAAHAPFGGNVVGLQAAAWKYFGRSADQLSWAEAATLGVLPNAPGLIHPGRNRDHLLVKRNFLLEKLLHAGKIDSLEWELSLSEPLPDSPPLLPNLAPHLLERVRSEQRVTSLTSTIDKGLQIQANHTLNRHSQRLRQNGIYNGAILIAEVETGAVLAYVGNTEGEAPDGGHAVDIVTANRSTGSILKPFLFASMLHDGELLPRTLLPDIPSYFGSFVPTNYNRTYHGSVAAADALAQSLNIPAVRMLQMHGVNKFASKLKKLGITSLFRPADQYGLSLILGGAEANLWDLAGAYASMARSLRLYAHYDGRYDPEGFRPLTYDLAQARYRWGEEDRDKLVVSSVLSAGSIWHSFEAMQEVSRPGEEAAWRQFGSTRRVAWKTGTSFGFRDAWAVGVTPEYVVAVWVGNADGEGRPGLIGNEAAAPLLFDLFSMLPVDEAWFRMPYDDLRQAQICRQSGHRAGSFCTVKDSVFVPVEGLRTSVCPYHHQVWLSGDGQSRVHSDCEAPYRMQEEVFFVLPPVQEFYYRREHPNYRALPAWRPDCLESQEAGLHPITVIYPNDGTKVYIPVGLDGASSQMILEAAHRYADTQLFWHLDETFLGTTSHIHQKNIHPSPGKHRLVVVDEEGYRVEVAFEVLEKDP